MEYDYINLNLFFPRMYSWKKRKSVARWMLLNPSKNQFLSSGKKDQKEARKKKGKEKKKKRLMMELCAMVTFQQKKMCGGINFYMKMLEKKIVIVRNFEMESTICDIGMLLNKYCAL